MSNIPIYRAKKIDSDEYVEGYLMLGMCSNGNGTSSSIHFNIQDKLFYIREIDTTTLAIHFPDMLDSQGNKIFASLSEDGKGGDILEVPFEVNNMDINFTLKLYDVFSESLDICIIIGIQK